MIFAIQLNHRVRTLTLAGAATAALFGADCASAQVLPVGGSTLTPGVTLAMNPFLAGTAVEDGAVNFSFTSHAGDIVKGSVQQRVVQSVDGSADFYWRIEPDTFSASRIKTITILGFNQDPSSLLQANYRIDGSGTVPSSYATRSAGLGDKISFEIPNGVGPDESSRFLLLDSKLNTYSKSGYFYLTAQDGSSSPLYKTFVPGVPEPSTWSLALAGLVGLYVRRWALTKRSQSVRNASAA